MQKLTKIIRGVDQFGIKFYNPIQDDQTTYKTFLGALSTLAIYSTGLIYFIYLFTLFVLNDIPPNLSQVQSYIKSERTYLMKKPLFAMNFNIAQPKELFDINRIYFQIQANNYHQGSQLINSTFLQTSGCDKVIPNNKLVGYYCFDAQFEISLEPNQPGTEKYIEINFYACSNESLLPGQYCASDQEILATQQAFQLISFFQEYDYKTKQIVYAGRSVYYFLQRNNGWALSFQLTDYQIDEGLIMQSFRNLTTVSGMADSSYTFNGSMNSPVTPFLNGNHMLNQIQINLQPQLQVVSIQYKKIASLLAEFQGLFSVLLALGIILNLFAERQCRNMIIDVMIRRFFPNTNKESRDLILNVKNHQFSSESLIKKIRVQEIMKELIELRLIVNLLLSQKQHQQLDNLGLDIQQYMHEQINSKQESIQLKLAFNKTGIDPMLYPFENIPQLDKQRDQSQYPIQIESLGISSVGPPSPMPDSYLNQSPQGEKQIGKQINDQNYLNQIYLNNDGIDTQLITNNFLQVQGKQSIDFSQRFNQSLTNTTLIQKLQQNQQIDNKFK